MESAIATVIVAIIGLIGVIIQTKSHSKLKTQEDLLKNVDVELGKLREESKKDDNELKQTIDDMELNNCKRFLIIELMKIKDGTYIPNEEQKRMLKETKERYNNRGGDSYIDEMYEDLRDKKLI